MIRLDKILFILLLFSLCSTFSQTKNDKKLKEISFSELIEKMSNGNDSIFTLKNTLIEFDKKKDEKYCLFEYRFKEKEYPTDTIHIYKTINFENVHFEKYNNVYNYAFINFYFHKPVSFKNTYNLSMFNCKFENSFTYNNSNTTNLTNINSFWLTDCVFNSNVFINDYGDNQLLYLTLTNNTFNYFKSDNYSEFWENSLLRINTSKSALFNFTSNKINYNNATFLIQILDAKEVYFAKNIIQSKYWNYLFLDNIEKLSLTDNKIETDLLFGIDKIKSEYDMQWPITDYKIIPLKYIFSNQENFKIINNKILNSLYKHKKVTDISYYKNELTQLSKFHSYFKDFHDRQSANNVYIKIKDLETERLLYLYNKNKSFDNYFELIVNRFLKKFSNYGTSPSNIVISSFKIILLFAFLFLFSKNSWNKLNISNLNKRIRQSIIYFTSDNNIIKAFEINNNKITENKNLKIVLKKKRNQIPKVVSFFSQQLLNLQTKLSQIKLSFWSYLDIVKSSWNELSSLKKMFNSILLLIIIITFILSKLTMVILNSITLSINSFTTLGFGEIPIKGIGRYLAIIEGFIGWIFLTLFSVTLISQILS